MKPFYWIDKTNKHNYTRNTESFVAQRITKENVEAISNLTSHIDKKAKKKDLPLFFYLLEYVAFLIIIGIVPSIIKAGVITPYGLLLSSVFVASILYLVIIKRIDKKREKAFLEDKNIHKAYSRSVEIYKQTLLSFNLPKNAQLADIFTNSYEIEDGQYKLHSQTKKFDRFFNEEEFIYVENGALCIVNSKKKIVVPGFQPKFIQRVDKSVSFPNWNKKESHMSEKFKLYSVKYDGYAYICKYYYILHFDVNGERWCLYFPPYELPFFESITGLKAN